MLLLLLQFNLLSQDGFELVIDDEMRSAVNGTIIDNSGNLVGIGNCLTLEDGVNKRSFIFSISNVGETIISYFEFEQDTSCTMQNVVQTSDGNFISFGSIGVTLSSQKRMQNIWLIKFDQELNTIWEKIYHLSEDYWNPLYKIQYFSNYGHIYLVGTIAYNGSISSHHLFLMKIGDSGDSLLSALPNNPNTLSNKIFSLMSQNDSNGIFAIGHGFDGSSSLQIIEIDSALNYTVAQLVDPDFNNLYQSTTKQFTDTTYLLCCEGTNNNKSYYRDIQVNLMNTSHQFIDRLWLERPDTNDTPAWVKSIDYTDKNNIWVAGSINHAYPEPMDTEVLVYLIDDQLNIKGLKYYGGDMNYSVMTVTATPDGGCVIAGTVCDWENNVPMDTDIWIKKIFPSDILTHAEDTRDPFDKDVLVYPNPFLDKLFVKTSRTNLKLKLYNLNGEEILSSNISPNIDFIIDTQQLIRGVYVYEIIYNRKTIQTGKLIK